MTKRQAAALPALLALVACGSASYRAVLVYPSDAAFERAATVELFVGEGIGCAELKLQATLPRLIFDAHAEEPTLGRIAFGRAAVLARVRDGDCTSFLSGCAESVIEAGSSATLRIPLEPTAGSGCRSDERCQQARCLATDASAADAGASDAAATDTLVGDRAIADVASADAATADSTIADSATADSTVADSATVDRAASDGSITDAATVVVPTAGLIGHWTFDETSGTVAHDSSGNGHHGAVFGATWISGHRGGALSFAATRARVQVPYAASLNLTGPMTLAAWFNAAGHQGAWARIIDRDYNSSYSLCSGNGLDDIEFWLDGQLLTDSGDGAVQLDTWMHAAVTFDNADLATLYLDGQVVATGSLTGSVQGNGSDLLFGARSVNGYDFVGLLDGIYIYDRALSAAEIDLLYQAGD